MDQETTLSIGENASTGYAWLLEPVICDEYFTVKTRVGHPDENEPEIEHIGVVHESMMVGVPGTKYIQFEPLKVGDCLVKMVLARSWEFSWESPESGMFVDKL